MADLTKDASIAVFGEAYTRKMILDTSIARVVFKGDPIVIDQSADTVNVAQQDSTVALVDGDVFMGIAAEGVTVAAGDAETLAESGIDVYVEPTIVGFISTVLTNANCGDTIYMSDTATLATANGTYAKIGKLDHVAEGRAWVRLVSPVNLDVP